MFVISTRNFPPDLGGIQNLIEGLAKALISHGPVKVFADSFPDSEIWNQFAIYLVLFKKWGQCSFY